MLTLRSLGLRRGNQILFTQASLTLHRQQRLGLTGANGTGKSSLLAMIRGELSPDSGDYELQGGLTLAHVAQETPALDCSALDYVLDGDGELRQLQQQIQLAEQQSEHHRHSELLAQLETIDGYTAEARAARLLNGLGFHQAELAQPVTAFSGGWRMRLNLAQALMCRSDLLLLDEPTNHLDMDAILWLEGWLKQYQGALILISHDRDFLDSVCSHIAHIEQGRLTLYSGNYSAFEIARAEKLAQQQAAFEKQQREIKHIHSFVERFRAKATKAKQAQSRIKALERMEKLAPAHIDSPFHFGFLPPRKALQHLLKIERGQLGYEQPLLSEVTLSVISGDRIGLLGPNGAGKSTLLKTLAGEQPLFNGLLEHHPDCRIGYFAQHQLEQLQPQWSGVQHLAQFDNSKSEQELRDFLGGFGFQGERALEPVAPFSGGEKARLVLAMLVFQRPNLLLLDEPTNHLDLEMRLALTLALQEFDGAVMVISHDRHLLRSVCDELYTICSGQFQHFAGDLDDYPAWLEQQQSLTQPAPAASAPKANKKQQRQQEAERRKQLKPLRDRVQQAEKNMDQLNKEKSQLEQKLSEESLYTDPARKEELSELIRAQGQLREQLEETELAWLEASEALEAAISETS